MLKIKAAKVGKARESQKPCQKNSLFRQAPLQLLKGINTKKLYFTANSPLPIR
jgi:hypothetical protein